MRNVTEDIALSILETYPTLYSLALAYTELVSVPFAKESVLSTMYLEFSVLNFTKSFSS